MEAAGVLEPERAGAVTALDVQRTYGQGDSVVHALRGVTAHFPPAQFAAVMGPSGSGKSTLLHILAGLDRPTAGRVLIEGRDIGAMGDRELTQLRRHTVGFIFQGFNLLPMLTAEENILLPLSLAGGRADQEWVGQLVRSVGLERRLSHRPAELSGGQQQRVAIARALVTRPAVLFADEPTGNLDSRTSAEILELLARATDELGQTIVMVTHDPRVAAGAERVLFLADGRIVQDRGATGAEEILDAMKGLD